MSAGDTKPKPSETILDGGTYDIIRNRLTNQGKELKTALNNLNTARKDVFGSIESTLIGTDRISTRNNCIPRDIVAIGDNRFLFGYNVHMGLKSETELNDVFAIYEYHDQAFHEISLDILRIDSFLEDFKNLYKYYKETRFTKFASIGPHLFMVFRVGQRVEDIKTFKWLSSEDKLNYVDNRSDHEYKFPPQHDFTWIRTNRDAHRFGRHPHISIEDRIFVEAVGGDITFKIEDNTDTGYGIYAEPVDNLDQTLDDADTAYAILGHLILVRIKPYLEDQFRHFIFNEKTQEVHRVDAVADACILLPDNQGLIFSNGYYLQTGELKTFESKIKGLKFETRIASANGEDYLYVFYHPVTGDYMLLPYNVIEQKVENWIHCNGYTLFPNGEMIYFQKQGEPAKHHVVSIWQTPYIATNYALKEAFVEKKASYLYKIGNPQIVRCMAEINELLKLIGKEESYEGLYLDIVKKATDIADAYFWLKNDEAFQIHGILSTIKATANSAIDEFEKIVRIRKETAKRVRDVTAAAQELLNRIESENFEKIDGFVSYLSSLRKIRGEIISLKELRYIDIEAIEKLEEDVARRSESLAERCVGFLLEPESLIPYAQRIDAIDRQIEGVAKTADAEKLKADADSASEELEMLIDIVSNLKIDDATHSTRIIEHISALYSRLNRTKAAVKNKKKTLQGVESVAQFNAQVKLLDQSAVNYLDIAETPQKCDEYLTKIMVQIEELEGRFADFAEFIRALAEKRDELYNAFETKKLGIVENRNKRAAALISAAERILKGIGNRVSGMDDISTVNGYFASDLMVEKIRDIIRQLVDLEDVVKADDIEARLKTLREDSIRQLKDRKELFEEGENIIRLGRYKFSVNTQSLDLTTVMKDGVPVFHLTGTNFFEPIVDQEFSTTRPVWGMEVLSENTDVYRCEYMAYRILTSLNDPPGENGFDNVENTDRLSVVREYMASRYSEGYIKGVHDHDGAKILAALAKIHSSAGLLRFHPKSRALARLSWRLFSDEEKKERLSAKLKSFGVLRRLFPAQHLQDNYIRELEDIIGLFAESAGLFPKDFTGDAARYLFFELSENDRFVTHRQTLKFQNTFLKYLKERQFLEKFESARQRLTAHPVNEYELVRDWVKGFIEGMDAKEAADYIDDVAETLFSGNSVKPSVIDIPMTADIEEMTGDHPVIRDGVYRLNYYTFMEKITAFETTVSPMFIRFQEMKKALVEKMREDLRLEEFRPRVLTSFVRNKLINEVYLPIIGDNLAKQIGGVGEGKRTDLMGLLLLISPPGYGKTTLMEYIANRLGVIFMKINGPAIGHRVLSLDPAEAPNAGARQELEKLNLSFEMGDNVMIYIDDIQHVNPEFLQKFISLCDAQRKIEGIYKGKSRTYDFRGKKVAVVMAGNPYTESGEKFRIPDMLANRADTYNLGDIIGDSADVFEMSYLENAVTSNPVLRKLSGGSQKDVHAVIRIAETGSREGVELEGNYGKEDVEEMVSVMKKLCRVRDIILKVNKAYIYSAAQSDDYREEPPFRLQGSYRNMNRLAEKILPVMNEDELKTLILSDYESEAQTLTTGGEANLLKFKELTGWISESERMRWQDIKRTFKKNKIFRGMDGSDPTARVVAQLSGFQDGLDAIRGVLEEGMTQMIQTRESRKAADETEDVPSIAQISFTDEAFSKLEELIREVKNQTARIMEQNGKADWMKSSFKAKREIEKMRSVYQEIVETKENAKRTVFTHMFYLMIKKGDIRAVEAILNRGTDANAVNAQGKTPLMAATLHGRPEIVKRLIDAGADINAADHNGYTALMTAAYKGHENITRMLLNSGANPDLTDHDGHSALMWAQKNRHKNVVQLLKETMITAS